LSDRKIPVLVESLHHDFVTYTVLAIHDLFELEQLLFQRRTVKRRVVSTIVDLLPQLSKLLMKQAPNVILRTHCLQ
jgi:hypothetical protein